MKSGVQIHAGDIERRKLPRDANRNKTTCCYDTNMTTKPDISRTPPSTPKWLPWILLLASVVLALLVFGDLPRLLQQLSQGERLNPILEQAGHYGPLIVIALMTIAVVASPLPSAPIAVASGALYGHGWGALYVLAGAQLGAMICFGLARGLGYEALHRWFGDKLQMGLLGSQRALSYGILVSRLLPFISFDIVSYAAGLTVIRFWRFAVATLVGIAPSSFLLAHIGSDMTEGEWARMGVTVLLLGGITLIPIIMVKHLRGPPKSGR